jgi:hypothetical protein
MIDPLVTGMINRQSQEPELMDLVQPTRFHNHWHSWQIGRIYYCVQVSKNNQKPVQLFIYNECRSNHPSTGMDG